MDLNLPGMQEVRCVDCGESLGAQDARVPIDRRNWEHNRCPVRIARSLGLATEEWSEVFDLVTLRINASYPDFPSNVIGNPKEDKVRDMRARIAAGTALEHLGLLGYSLIKQEEV